MAMTQRPKGVRSALVNRYASRHVLTRGPRARPWCPPDPPRRWSDRDALPPTRKCGPLRCFNSSTRDSRHVRAMPTSRVATRTPLRQPRSREHEQTTRRVDISGLSRHHRRRVRRENRQPVWATHVETRRMRLAQRTVSQRDMPHEPIVDLLTLATDSKPQSHNRPSPAPATVREPRLADGLRHRHHRGRRDLTPTAVSPEGRSGRLRRCRSRCPTGRDDPSRGRPVERVR